jgi:hypothetical protein
MKNNKERYNQIINEVYESYSKFAGFLEEPDYEYHVDDPSQNRTRLMTNEEFINKMKTDQEFSERWGLGIKERELSLDERMQIWNERTEGLRIMLMWGHGKTQEESLSEQNIPTKLITLTHNEEK